MIIHAFVVLSTEILLICMGNTGIIKSKSGIMA